VRHLVKSDPELRDTQWDWLILSPEISILGCAVDSRVKVGLQDEHSAAVQGCAKAALGKFPWLESNVRPPKFGASGQRLSEQLGGQDLRSRLVQMLSGEAGPLDSVDVAGEAEVSVTHRIPNTQ
jgi:hypothetical protein